MKFSELMSSVNETLKANGFDEFKIVYNPGTQTIPTKHARLFSRNVVFDDELLLNLFTNFKTKVWPKGVQYFLSVEISDGIEENTDIIPSILKQMQESIIKLARQRSEHKNLLEKISQQIGINPNIQCTVEQDENNKTELTFAGHDFKKMRELECYLQKENIEHRLVCYSGSSVNHIMILDPLSLQESQIQAIKQIAQAKPNNDAPPATQPIIPAPVAVATLPLATAPQVQAVKQAAPPAKQPTIPAPVAVAVAVATPPLATTPQVQAVIKQVAPPAVKPVTLVEAVTSPLVTQTAPAPTQPNQPSGAAFFKPAQAGDTENTKNTENTEDPWEKAKNEGKARNTIPIMKALDRMFEAYAGPHKEKLQGLIKDCQKEKCRTAENIQTEINKRISVGGWLGNGRLNAALKELSKQIQANQINSQFLCMLVKDKTAKKPDQAEPAAPRMYNL